MSFINLITKYETGDANSEPTSLLQGQLAVNTQAGKLWVGNAAEELVSLLEAPVLTGTVDGQTMRWEATTNQWQPTDALTVSDANLVTVNTLAVTNGSTLANITSAGTINFTGATISNLGTVSTVDLNGGSIDGTVIGGSSPAAGSFTSLSASGSITVAGTVDGRDVAADGALVDTALQPSDNISELTNDVGYITDSEGVPDGGTLNQVLTKNSGANQDVIWKTPVMASGLSPVIITVATTALAGDQYLCDMSSGAYTLTLPASPVVGDLVGVLDLKQLFDTTNLTVGRDGSNIMGLAEDLVIDIKNVSLVLQYADATQGWVLS